MNSRYILIGQTPVLEPSLEKWAEWFGRSSTDGSRVVAQTEVGASVVSTVFLGLDHQWGHGPPILFETMIFTDGESEDFQQRCSTWLEAEAQHGRVVAMVHARFSQPPEN